MMVVVLLLLLLLLVFFLSPLLVGNPNHRTLTLQRTGTKTVAWLLRLDVVVGGVDVDAVEDCVG